MAFMGELSDVGVTDVLYLLSLRRHTGRLTISANGDEVGLFLTNGQPVLVTSTNLALRLGRTLIRQGFIDASQLQEALREQEITGYGRPLGSILVGRGWVTLDELAHALEEQCIDALARVIVAETGSFLFSPGISPPPRTELIPLNVDRILIEAMRRTDELATLRRLLPAPAAPIRLGKMIDEIADTLGDAEVLVAATLVTGPATLSELAERVTMDELALWRTLISMRERGLIVSDPAPVPSLSDLLEDDENWLVAPGTDELQGNPTDAG